MDGVAHHNKRLEDLIRLAEMCVDQLQQNEEHYAEVSWCSFVLIFFIFFQIINLFGFSQMIP